MAADAFDAVEIRVERVRARQRRQRRVVGLPGAERAARLDQPCGTGFVSVAW
jgi:hypothetical protein